MIIVDFNQIAMSCVVQFKKDLEKKPPDELKGIIFHMVLNSLIAYRKKFKSYGDMVIAVDGRNNWRKQVFPYYKGNRKKSRDEDSFDWNEIWKIFDELYVGIKDGFPWKIIKVDVAEGDDVIAIVTKHVTEKSNDFVWGEETSKEDEKVIVISSDGDFKQLLKNPLVSQYCHKKKKLVKISKSEIETKITEHIVKGDSGDGIPNILSSDNCLVDGIRQNPLSKVRLDEFMINGENACKNEVEKRNWKRNHMLVSFDAIPEHVSKEVIKELNNPQAGNKKTAMDFMFKHRLTRLVNELQDI